VGVHANLVLTWVVAAVAVLVHGTLVAFLEPRVAQIGLGAALGGAARNVIDRFRRGVLVITRKCRILDRERGSRVPVLR